MRGIDNIGVGVVVDQADHATRPEPLGEHGRQDIRLIVIGDGAEHIGILDVLADQQFLVRGFADQNGGAFQLAGNLLGTLFVPFDDLDVIAAFQRLRHALAKMPAPAKISRL